MTTLTKSQTTAITEHSKNVIVSAGAGSGKTHVLVERYLALLEENPSWHLNNIIAITFTKKAADEMRDRVRQKLENRFHRASANNDAEWADRWAQWLSEIGGAQISTIHGLCADLLRANFAEAGLDPDFTVLDEIGATLLLEQAVSDVLAGLTEEIPPAPELRLFDHYQEYIVRDLLMDANLIAKDVQPMTNADAHYQQFLDDLITQMHTIADAEGAYTIHDTDDRWQTLVDSLNVIRKHPSPQDISDALQAICDIKLSGKGLKSITNPTMKAVIRALRDIAAENIAKVTSYVYADDSKALESAWVLLMKRVREAYTSAKQHQNALDFDDLEKRAHALITQNQAVVMRYRGKEILHLMVDEFQDTNPTQWGIVQGLGGGVTTAMTFLVGDDKQSIYGFRGADVSVFHAVRGQIVTAGGENPALNTSFRTRQPLVNWFNRVFGRLLAPDETLPPEIRNFQVGYGEPMEAFHITKPNADYPPVRVLVINNRTADMDEKKKFSNDERREWEASTIADHIQRLINEKMPVRDKHLGVYRPVQYRDIALLFRAMTHVGTYEETFKRLGIPFVTVAGKGYYDRQEAWDVIHLLQTLYNPYDELALVSVLRSPMFGMSDEGLLALRLFADAHDNAPLWDALPYAESHLPLDDQPHLQHAQAVLHDLHGQIGRVSLAELIRTALEHTQYLATLSGLPDGDRRRGNIEKLLEKATSSGMASLGDFVAYWRNLNERQTREGEAPLEVGNAITLMTVHASKGLEYPVIFIPEATRKTTPETAPLIYEAGGMFGCKVMDTDKLQKSFAYHLIEALNKAREDAESLRLLYVAATRAGDMLYLSGNINLTSKGELNTYGGWLKQIVDALGIEDSIHQALSDALTQCDVGDTQIFIPQTRAKTQSAKAQTQDAWATNFSGHTPISLPLLDAVTIEAIAPSRHLSATTLADLGAIEHTSDDQRQVYIQRFRQQVYKDAPERVTWISDAHRIQQRTIGEVVHEALRHWQLPSTLKDDRRMKHLLENYAWRYGARDADDIRDVVAQAMNLLQKFERHTLYQTINNAHAVYRELPFVLQWDEHLIHGVIDVLCLTDNGWTVYDYKTGGVRDIPHDDHAKRYHLQVAIYARAVEAQVGIFPNAAIYYIRHNRLVPIATEALQGELSYTLTDRIQRLEQWRD